MNAPKQYFFVCTNERKPGTRESCGADHATRALARALRDEIKARGLKREVRVTSSGCLGLCKEGPHAVLFPRGVLFAGFSEKDVPKLADAIWTEDK